VALFSLIEALDTDASDVAAVLDEALKNSLGKRTLAREDEPTRTIERELLRSRAQWLWRRSTEEQRRACFYSGLGRKPGLFLHEQLDALVDVLCTFQAAVAVDDGDPAAAAATALYEEVMKEPFFAVRKLPSDWQKALAEWIKGTAFSEILKGRKARDARRTQVFIQEGIVFRLVWAAEAVRVQAVATGHARASELGDGPAFALTYAAPSIPAALFVPDGFLIPCGCRLGCSRARGIFLRHERVATVVDAARRVAFYPRVLEVGRLVRPLETGFVACKHGTSSALESRKL